jgi:hypothetical protein
VQADGTVARMERSAATRNPGLTFAPPSPALRGACARAAHSRGPAGSMQATAAVSRHGIKKSRNNPPRSQWGIQNCGTTLGRREAEGEETCKLTPCSPIQRANARTRAIVHLKTVPAGYGGQPLPRTVCGTTLPHGRERGLQKIVKLTPCSPLQGANARTQATAHRKTGAGRRLDGAMPKFAEQPSRHGRERGLQKIVKLTPCSPMQGANARTQATAHRKTGAGRRPTGAKPPAIRTLAAEQRPFPGAPTYRRAGRAAWRASCGALYALG